MADVQAQQIQVKFVNHGPDGFVIYEACWVGGDVEPAAIQLLSAEPKAVLDDEGSDKTAKKGKSRRELLEEREVTNLLGTWDVSVGNERPLNGRSRMTERSWPVVS